MNWNLGYLLYISDWSKFVGPKLDFILDQTHCIWAYWVTGFILAIGLAGMTINNVSHSFFFYSQTHSLQNALLDSTVSHFSCNSRLVALCSSCTISFATLFLPFFFSLWRQLFNSHAAYTISLYSGTHLIQPHIAYM